MVTITILLILGILTGLEGFDLLYVHIHHTSAVKDLCATIANVMWLTATKPGIVRMQVLVAHIRRLQFL